MQNWNRTYVLRWLVLLVNLTHAESPGKRALMRDCQDQGGLCLCWNVLSAGDIELGYIHDGS